MRRRRQSFRNSWIAIRASRGDASARCARSRYGFRTRLALPEEQLDPGMGANRQPAGGAKRSRLHGSPVSHDGLTVSLLGTESSKCQSRIEAQTRPAVGTRGSAPEVSNSTACSEKTAIARQRPTGSQQTRRWRRQVLSELVSEAKFPASWENTGNFIHLGLRVRLLARNPRPNSGLTTNSLRIGTGNLFRPSRELNQIIREFIRLIRESRAGRDLTAT